MERPALDFPHITIRIYQYFYTCVALLLVLWAPLALSVVHKSAKALFPERLSPATISLFS